jgi:ribulose-5-phosphate 4-epimerase/fuculose-1-phosphate aldolase
MKDLLELAHFLSPFVVGTEGNVSQKIGDNFYIKASGTELKTLSKKDLIKCSLKEGKQLTNFSKKPSMETNFHNWLLQKQDINFVAHTHPVNTLKILCSVHTEELVRDRLFPDQVVFNGEISCLVEYAHPGIELKKAIEKNVTNFEDKYNKFPKLILLKNHGIICCGKTFKECLIATQICEKASEILMGAEFLGLPSVLTQKQIEKIANDKKEIYRQKIL